MEQGNINENLNVNIQVDRKSLERLFDSIQNICENKRIDEVIFVLSSVLVMAIEESKYEKSDIEKLRKFFDRSLKRFMINLK